MLFLFSCINSLRLLEQEKITLISSNATTKHKIEILIDEQKRYTELFAKHKIYSILEEAFAKNGIPNYPIHLKNAQYTQKKMPKNAKYTSLNIPKHEKHLNNI